MTYSYQVERWGDVWHEMAPLWQAHYEDVARDRDKIALDPDLQGYAALDAAGILHVVTARLDGKLIGYHVSLVKSHLHYRSTLFAYVDMYYVSRAYRRGMLAAVIYRGLFRAADASLKARGVQKVCAMYKCEHTLEPLFRRLGYQHAEDLWTKYIGD